MVPANLGRCIGFVLIVAGALTGEATRASDPQPYSVTITATGEDALDASLNDGSLLASLRDRAPVPPFGLIERANRDIERLTSVLQSFGYYRGSAQITIGDYRLDDPALLPFLDETPAVKAVPVRIAIEPAELYHLRKVTVEGELPPEAQGALMLASGAPAISADIVAAQGRLLATLQEAGYAFAEVSDPTAYADDDAHVLDLTFQVKAGAKTKLGDITFQGLGRVNHAFAEKSLTVHSGDQYRPSAIESARQALVSTGVFSTVNVTPGEHGEDGDRVPLTFNVQERPARAVNFTGAYSTDLGISLSAGWSHRNLFGNAEQLNLSAAETGLGGTATGSLGYRLTAQFIKPLFNRLDQTLQLDASAVKQDLIAYQQQADSAGATLRRKLTPSWTGSIGINVMQDKVSQKGTDRIYQLVSFPVTAAYDTTGTSDPLRDPLRGIRASVVATPVESFGARTNTFWVLQALGSTYFDLSGDGRSVLALRGQAGSVVGASNLDLPPDQRLYAGGSATVRGFRYQSIGPLFTDGDPIGGTAVDAGTIELRQRLIGNFGLAAFVDAGQASAHGLPFAGPIWVGAGLGGRYYTSIGAVRVDLAVPLTKVPSGDTFELYIGLGQAF